MPVSESEKDLIRDLARRVAEIAALPVQEEKKELWTRLNRLERVRPLIHRKMHVVRKIRNLRRVSMSPWVDIDVASAAVGKDFVYTHKPNPSIVSMEQWHPDLARTELQDTFEKTRENIVEVNLQDLHTVRNEPHRLAEWTRIAMELSEEYA